MRSIRNRRIAVGAAVSGVVAASINLRRWREENQVDLPLALSMSYSPQEVLTFVERGSLMGYVPNVSHELHDIREWHRANGFVGGITLRELSKPLYGRHTPETDTIDTNDDFTHRNCYYLYYEITGTGQVKQQVFCRGTTVQKEVITDLKTVYVYDDELGCNLHMGFREKADRLLADLEPLLTDPSDQRATVEVCGHSLGGAVALIVAIKLKKRGHTVTRAITFGSPKPCDASAVPILQEMLPTQVLRVEHERDAITLLPPHGAHLGDKLWLLEENKKSKTNPFRFVRFSADLWWVDSFFVNWLFPETLLRTREVHSSNAYIVGLKRLVDQSAELRNK